MPLCTISLCQISGVRCVEVNYFHAAALFSLSLSFSLTFSISYKIFFAKVINNDSHTAGHIINKIKKQGDL